MRTERGLARLIAFSDGVVAIAITLLILPLVTSAAEITTDVWVFLAANVFQLLVMVISFLVIGRFWLIHHKMYENVASYNTKLLWANLLWLFGIVFLPFPTELLSGTENEDNVKYALYIGTMTLISGAALLQQWIIASDPTLQTDEARGTVHVSPFVVTTGLMVVALIIATAFPVVGLWALFLLFLSGPLERLVLSRRKL